MYPKPNSILLSSIQEVGLSTQVFYNILYHDILSGRVCGKRVLRPNIKN